MWSVYLYTMSKYLTFASFSFFFSFFPQYINPAQTELDTASRERKRCKNCRLLHSSRMLNLEKTGFYAHPETPQRRLNSHRRGLLSTFQRQVEYQNPSSALSLASPYRWSTVIRFLCSPSSLSSCKVYILH